MDPSLTAEAISEAKAVLTALESSSTPLSRIALRARRLADFVEDDGGAQWLQLEYYGVRLPLNVDPGPKSEATKRAYFRFLQNRTAPNWSQVTPSEVIAMLQSGRRPPDVVVGAPLSQLEAAVPSFEESDTADPIEALLASDPIYQFEVAIQKRSIMADRQAGVLKSHIVEKARHQVVERVRHSIHEWASGVYKANRLRQATGNVFESFRTRAEAVLASLCPDAAEKLDHAVRRLSPNSGPEEWSAAGMSCRRMLKSIADRLYPPSSNLVEGRQVDSDHYKNRLWAWVRERKALAPHGLGEQIDAVCAQLDDLYQRSSKGVHAEFDRYEAELCVLQAYVIVSSLAQLYESGGEAVAAGE